MADNYKPPEAAQRAAAHGLELRRKYGRGGTAVGVARARDLSNGKSVSRSTVARMSSFARHMAQRKAILPMADLRRRPLPLNFGAAAWASTGLARLWSGSSLAGSKPLADSGNGPRIAPGAFGAVVSLNAPAQATRLARPRAASRVIGGHTSSRDRPDSKPAVDAGRKLKSVHG